MSARHTGIKILSVSQFHHLYNVDRVCYIPYNATMIDIKCDIESHWYLLDTQKVAIGFGW